MRRVLCIAAISATLVGSVGLACAADMATKAAPMPAKAPVAPPVALYNWNGFYVGANLGYGWNNVDSTSTNLATGEQTSTSSTRHGVFGGGQIGYNWQFDPNWLIGIEGDIDAAGLTGSVDGCSSTGCSHSDGKNKWFATVRGRLGLVQNNWLFFVTGGAAWLDGSTTRTITAVTNPANAVLVGQSSTASGTDTGWTVGGGVDWGVAPNWSVNLEYRYMHVNTGRDFTYSLPTAARHVDSEDQIHTVRVSLDYHFH
jgi:outer membrane immunogenic protein